MKMLIGRFHHVLLRTAILLFSFQKGLDWHSREAVSSQAATKWQIHLVQVSSPDECMDPISMRGQIQRYQKILSPPE